MVTQREKKNFTDPLKFPLFVLLSLSLSAYSLLPARAPAIPSSTESPSAPALRGVNRLKTEKKQSLEADLFSCLIP